MLDLVRCAARVFTAVTMLIVTTPASAQHIHCPYGTVRSQFHARVGLIVYDLDGQMFTLGTVDECNVINFAPDLTIDDLKYALHVIQFSTAQRMELLTKLYIELEGSRK